jgi:hypothetical protein
MIDTLPIPICRLDKSATRVDVNKSKSSHQPSSSLVVCKRSYPMAAPPEFVTPAKQHATSRSALSGSTRGKLLFEDPWSLSLY